MKKLVLIVLPILLIGGAVVGLGMAGIVKIPGLTPKKAKARAAPGEAKEKAAAKKEPSPAKPRPDPDPGPVVVASRPKVDDERGARKLAQLWNSIPTASLVEVAKQFKDEDLAPILVSMDPEKVSELIAVLDPKRSAKLSREVQRVASLVKD